jgi:hypothetical protein
MSCTSSHSLSPRSRPFAVWALLQVLAVAFAVLQAHAVYADDATEIAKQAQNPVASLISVPFQDNINFGVGPESDVQNVLEIEPVIPLKLNDDWNVITRTIIPVVEQPTLAPGVGNVTGLGDIQPSFYLSPARPGAVIWGIGPSFSFASATDRSLGSGKDSAWLSAAALTIHGHWLVGALITDVVSVGGEKNRESVSQFLIQPFINYNFSHGWYLTSSPIVTANWKGTSGNKWTVPVGGGGGKIFHVGHQAFNAIVQGFDDVSHPHEAGNWTLRLQLSLLFPKSK